MCVSRSFLALMLAGAVTIAAVAGDAPKVSGSITANGKTTALKYAYAMPKDDPFDKKKKATWVLVTDQEVPAAVLADEFELMSWRDKAKLHGFEVLITDDKRVVSGNIYDPAMKHNGFSSVGSQQVELTALTPQRVAGKISIPPGEFFGDNYQYTATFDVPVVAVKPPAPEALKGTPLPAGGGEPAKAYAAYSKAIGGGDIAALKKLVSKERASQMDSKEFKEMFGLIQAMQPKNVKITGGAVDGETATLLATAKDGKDTSTGTITMVREGGAWKVQQDSWKTRSE